MQENIKIQRQICFNENGRAVCDLIFPIWESAVTHYMAYNFRGKFQHFS